MQQLTAGITKANTGLEGISWNILGQTYVPKSLNEHSFSWHATFPPGTFVPPHIHPTQDEFIYMLDGRFDLVLDGKEFVATTGDLIRLPMNQPHGIFNKTDQTVKCFFWVAPTRQALRPVLGDPFDEGPEPARGGGALRQARGHVPAAAARGVNEPDGGSGVCVGTRHAGEPMLKAALALGLLVLTLGAAQADPLPLVRRLRRVRQPRDSTAISRPSGSARRRCRVSAATAGPTYFMTAARFGRRRIAQRGGGRADRSGWCEAGWHARDAAGR